MNLLRWLLANLPLMSNVCVILNVKYLKQNCHNVKSICFQRFHIVHLYFPTCLLVLIHYCYSRGVRDPVWGPRFWISFKFHLSHSSNICGTIYFFKEYVVLMIAMTEWRNGSRLCVSYFYWCQEPLFTLVQSHNCTCFLYTFHSTTFW